MNRLRTREPENRLVERMRSGTKEGPEGRGGGDCAVDGDLWMVSGRGRGEAGTVAD